MWKRLTFKLSCTWLVGHTLSAEACRTTKTPSLPTKPPGVCFNAGLDAPGDPRRPTMTGITRGYGYCSGPATPFRPPHRPSWPGMLGCPECSGHDAKRSRPLATMDGVENPDSGCTCPPTCGLPAWYVPHAARSPHRLEGGAPPRGMMALHTSN